MSFISYAQNFEDVMLWRALKHIKNGFYIDVGAYLPDDDSVTKAFYDNDWSGINIEPNPELYTLYLSKRERDINLKAALSDIVGETDIYFSDNAGLSSLDENIAKSHEALGVEVTPSKVKVTTLEEICKKYAQDKDIHFLKVDVEGFEDKVILGNDWQKYRPWIVVVEATMPMSQIENHDKWEHILLNADYLFAYADGLNRFYVSVEHKGLLASFKYPPNVFDDFIRIEEVKLQQQVQDIANDAIIQSQNLSLQIQELHTHAKNIQASYANSLSWKLTKPLRLINKLLRLMKR